MPILQPAGGHAIYLDARALLPHIPPLQYPGIALVNALYVAGGVRAVEIGTVMFGRRPDGTEAPAPMDLVRLALPRRVYTQSHIDYVAEVVIAVAQQRQTLARLPHRLGAGGAAALHRTVRSNPAVRVLSPSAPCTSGTRHRIRHLSTRHSESVRFWDGRVPAPGQITASPAWPRHL